MLVYDIEIILTRRVTTVGILVSTEMIVASLPLNRPAPQLTQPKLTVGWIRAEPRQYAADASQQETCRTQEDGKGESCFHGACEPLCAESESGHEEGKGREGKGREGKGREGKAAKAQPRRPNHALYDWRTSGSDKNLDNRLWIADSPRPDRTPNRSHAARTLKPSHLIASNTCDSRIGNRDDSHARSEARSSASPPVSPAPSVPRLQPSRESARFARNRR